MFTNLGRKKRGFSLGKKGQAFKKGVIGLGGVALLGAGIYAAYHSHENHHQNDAKLTEKESNAMIQRVEDKIEKEKKEKEVPMPEKANAVVFADAGGKVGKLDKVEDVIDVAKVGVEAARDVDEAEGKIGKVKAVAQGAKEVKDKVKEVGKKGREQKLVEGQLSEKQEAKMIKKAKKKARKEVSKEKCAEVFKATGKKGKALAPLRKLCVASGF
mgnify:CR=1 FL=1